LRQFYVVRENFFFFLISFSPFQGNVLFLRERITIFYRRTLFKLQGFLFVREYALSFLEGIPLLLKGTQRKLRPTWDILRDVHEVRSED